MSSRRIVPGFAALICVATLLLSACTGSDGASNTYRFDGATKIGGVIPPQDRKPAPKVDAKLLQGSGSMSLDATRGKPAVLAFWASWCGPCRTEMPQLSGLNTELAGKVTFLGVNSRDQDSSARQFMASNKITFASIVDRDGALPQKLGNIRAGLPFTVVLDKAGKVAAVYVVRYGAKDLDGALNTLLKEG